MTIWLQGPSGAGKSTSGRILAQLRGAEFVDLDEAIERAEGRSISDIIWSDGEEAFRRMEWNALVELTSDANGAERVVALGGGAVVDPAIRSLTRSTGVRIFLDVERSEAISRLEADSTPRPLLMVEDPEAEWGKRYRLRRRHYLDADVHLLSDAPASDIAERMAAEVARLEAPLWTIERTIGGEPTRVRCFRSLYRMLATLRSKLSDSTVAFITDQNVATYHGDLLFPEDGGETVLRIEAGEETKSLKTIESLSASLVASRFGRDGVLVGIGGGVVTDMSGFLGSTYMRGVRTIYMPTTLLAQVDASIGGKTAINAGGIRNLLGTIRQPSEVLICSAFLRTLPTRELRSGIVEAIKIGIIHSPELLEIVERSLDTIRDGDVPEQIDEIIRSSVDAKMRIVEGDVNDSGDRLSLNFGHTFGHALEATAPGEYTHGEAVAFGIVAAAEMARRLGTIGDARSLRIASLLLPFTHSAARPTTARLIEAMTADKKRSGGAIRFILPTEERGFRVESINDRAVIADSIERAFETIDQYHTTT